MFNRLMIIYTLLFCAQSWALNCSNPETLSDPRLNASFARIFSNSRGDAVIVWISEQGLNERLEISHKTQNSPWSYPESLSNWEKRIFRNYGFTNANGDLFATWETKDEDEFLIHIAEKIKGELWNVNSKWLQAETDFLAYDLGFDSVGNLIFIGEKEIPFTPKPTIKYTYKKTVPAIAIFTKSPARNEKKSDILPLEDAYFASKIGIVMNKNDTGYAFWIRHGLDQRLLMCQKITDSLFISDPEIVCSLNDYITELKADINEKGDIAIAYLDNGDNGYIGTKIDNLWSEPFLFSNKKEDPMDLNVAIDNSGNVMAVYSASAISAVKTIYKPIDQFWQSQTLFLTEDAINWSPDVRPDGIGNFVIIWQQEKQRRNAIFGRTFSTATRTWSDPQQLSLQGESCYGYSYTFWAPGKGYIAWTMSPNGYEEVIQVAELFN